MTLFRYYGATEENNDETLDKSHEATLRDMKRPFQVGDLAFHRLTNRSGRVVAIEAIGDIDQLLTVEFPGGQVLRAEPRKSFNFTSTIAHLVTTLAPADVVNPVIEKIAVDQPVDGYGTTSLLDELC